MEIDMSRLLVLLCAALFAISVKAATFVNTVGSDDGIAISSFDAVAFHTHRKAVLGKTEYAVRHLEATWLFASEENKAAFQAAPEKYMPEWGGHCAACIPESCISSKKLSGDFELVDGKLYLFSFGNRSRSSSRDNFVYGRTSKALLVQYGNKNWSAMRSQLEDGSLQQPDSKTYRKTQYEK
jgi:YHS domain-containing protein